MCNVNESIDDANIALHQNCYVNIAICYVNVDIGSVNVATEPVNIDIRLFAYSLEKL